MRLNDSQFQKMSDAVKGGKDSGFSEHASRSHRTSPKSGYVVSVPGFEQRIASENVSPAHIKDFVIRHQDQLNDPNRYVGGWNNGQNVALDVSQNIKPKKSVARKYGRDVASADARTSAMDLAVARNQESIWDVKKSKSIDNPAYEQQ